MALLADDVRGAEMRQYFASMGELASKIVQEAEVIRSQTDWEGLSLREKERIVDRHFVDDFVKGFYSGNNRSSSSLGAMSASGGASAGGDSTAGLGSDVPTWEMLYPRPIPLGGLKYVQVGGGEDGETSSATPYIDEFGGNFQWETRSQLELWLPEGQSLPSPRSVRRSMFKDDSHRVEVKRFSKLSEDPAQGNELDSSAGATSVKAMAKALQRTTKNLPGGGASSNSRTSGTALAPIPSAGTPRSVSPVPKTSPSLSRSQSTSQTKSSPDVAPKPPKRCSSIVGDSPSPQVKIRSAGTLSIPPPSKSAGAGSAEGGAGSDESAEALASGAGKSPRPSPPVRRDSLSKKTGSPYLQSPPDADAKESAYVPGGEPVTSSAAASAPVLSGGLNASAPPAAPAPSTAPTSSSTAPAAGSSGGNLPKPNRAPPPAPGPGAQRTPPMPAKGQTPPQRKPSTSESVTSPKTAGTVSARPQRPPPMPAKGQTPPQRKPNTPEPVTSPKKAGTISASSIETTFPASPDPLEGFEEKKVVGSVNAGGAGFDFLSNW